MSTSAVHLPALGIAAAPAAQTPAPSAWSPARRVAFRFGFVYLLLYNVLFVLQALTFGDLSYLWYPRLWEPLVAWVGAHVLHLATPIVLVPAGSGDTRFDWVLLLCYLAISAVAAAVWTAVDRRRTGYPAANDFLRTYVRYNVGFQMLLYASYKLVQTQFPPPGLLEVTSPLGRFSPMRLLWMFMGASYGYNLFAGLGEAVGGALLLWRRTTTLGAAILVAVLSNVVMLNFAYDVPVKLFSSHLLLMTLFLLAPQARRLVSFFVLNRPVPPEAVGRFAGGRHPRTRAALKAAVLAVVLAVPGYQAVTTRRQRAERGNVPLYGIYDVTGFSRNGYTPPAPLVERTRWRRVLIPIDRMLVVTDMNDSTFAYSVNVDTVAGRMEVTRFSEPDRHDVLRIARPSAGAVQLDGVLRGDTLSVRLMRIDETTLMPWRKPFQWVKDPLTIRR